MTNMRYGGANVNVCLNTLNTYQHRISQKMPKSTCTTERGGVKSHLGNNLFFLERVLFCMGRRY